MGFEGASGFHAGDTGGGGGTIGGGGTLNYVAMFTPDGVNIGNGPIKFGDTVTKALPVNTGTDTIAMGYDIIIGGGITDAVVIGIGNLNALTDEILIAINDLGIRIDLSGDVGIGIPSTDTIMARLHNRGVDINNVNQRLEPIVGVYEDTTGETLTLVSVGVTTSTLQTIPIPLNTVVLIESYITARKTAGAGVGAVSDGNGYVRTVKAKNVAGVVTIGVVQSSFTSEDIGPLNATLDVSGTNVRVRVTNSANQTIVWNVITKTYPVA